MSLAKKKAAKKTPKRTASQVREGKFIILDEENLGQHDLLFPLDQSVFPTPDEALTCLIEDGGDFEDAALYELVLVGRFRKGIATLEKA